MERPATVIARWAEAHHGVVGWHEALRLGLDVHHVVHLVDQHLLVRRHHGVYRWGGAPVTWRGELRAACLAAGPGAAASHRSAARLWGLRGDWPDCAEITAPGPRLPRLRDVAVHRAVGLAAGDRTERDGIRCLTVEVALLTLGGAYRHPTADRVVANAADDAVRLGLTSYERLEAVLARLGGRGRRGAAALRQLLDDRVGGRPTESALEVAFVDLLRLAGLDPPERQVVVALPSGRTVRLDFAYRALRLGFEVDGRKWHGSTGDERRDVARDAELRAIGWVVLRFDHRDVHHWPDRTAGTVARWAASRRLGVPA